MGGGHRENVRGQGEGWLGKVRRRGSNEENQMQRVREKEKEMARGRITGTGLENIGQGCKGEGPGS